MSVMELLASRRTYRRFEQKAVPQDVVEDIIEALRLSSCGANRQAVRLVVVNRPEDVARVQPLVKWAAYLPPEQGTPKADELPTLYVAVVQDTSIPGDLATDTGIALANMTLAAWAKGVGSCIMGAINKPALTQLLGIEEPQKLAFMVAFGYPAHKAGIVPLTKQTGVKYYQGTRSPNAAEKEEKGYSSAWLHHKGRNKHHFEYWTDVSTAEDHWKIVGVKMPVNYLAEMVMDRIAASKIYQGRNYTDAAPYTYFSRNKEYIVMHPETKACLDKILLMLKEKGERKTFAYIRKLLRDGDY